MYQCFTDLLMDLKKYINRRLARYTYTKSLPNLLVIPVSSLFKIDYKSSFIF